MRPGVPYERPIFIVGCPRSGTTLVRNLLRSHPRLRFPRESQFIPTFYAAYGDPTNADEARALAARILRVDWIRKWSSRSTSSRSRPSAPSVTW